MQKVKVECIFGYEIYEHQLQNLDTFLLKICLLLQYVSCTMANYEPNDSVHAIFFNIYFLFLVVLLVR